MKQIYRYQLVVSEQELAEVKEKVEKIATLYDDYPLWNGSICMLIDSFEDDLRTIQEIHCSATYYDEEN